MTDNEKDVLRRSDRLRNEKPDSLPKQTDSRQHIDIPNKYQEDGDIIEDHGEQFTLKRVVKEDSQNKDGLGAFCKSTVQGSIQAIAVKVVTGALVLGLCGLGINLGTSSNASNTQQTPSSTVTSNSNSNSDGALSNTTSKNNTTSNKKKVNNSSSNKKTDAVPNPQPVENNNSGISTPQKEQTQSNASSDQNSINSSESTTTNAASQNSNQSSTANNTTDQSSQSTDSTNTQNNTTTSEASSSDTSW